jgi:hypothetical protein
MAARMSVTFGCGHSLSSSRAVIRVCSWASAISSSRLARWLSRSETGMGVSHAAAHRV